MATIKVCSGFWMSVSWRETKVEIRWVVWFLVCWEGYKTVSMFYYLWPLSDEEAKTHRSISKLMCLFYFILWHLLFDSSVAHSQYFCPWHVFELPKYDIFPFHTICKRCSLQIRPYPSDSKITYYEHSPKEGKVNCDEFGENLQGI